MEADFALLRRDVRLTSTPKKAALEMLRRKIEEVRGRRGVCPSRSACSRPVQASDRVRNANQARAECASALAAAEELLEAEEAGKATLIRDLNSLIFQSSVQQMEALETLQTRMESLAVKAGGIVHGNLQPHPPTAAPGSAQPAHPGAGAAHPDAVTLARAEMAAVEAVQAAEITEARARHVSLNRPPRPPQAPVAPALPVRQTGGGFAGFE